MTNSSKDHGKLRGVELQQFDRVELGRVSEGIDETCRCKLGELGSCSQPWYKWWLYLVV